MLRNHPHPTLFSVRLLSSFIMQVRFTKASGGDLRQSSTCAAEGGVHLVVFIPNSFKPVKISPRHNHRTSATSDMWLLGIPPISPSQAKNLTLTSTHA